MSVFKAFKLALVLFALVLVGGCATTSMVTSSGAPRVYVNEAYTPTPEIRLREERAEGQLTGFTLSGRNMASYHLLKFQRDVEARKALCTYGVANEDRREESRPNPYIDRNSRVLYAVGAGIREQLMVYEADVRVRCLKPPQRTPAPKQR